VQRILGIVAHPARGEEAEQPAALVQDDALEPADLVLRLHCARQGPRLAHRTRPEMFGAQRPICCCKRGSITVQKARPCCSSARARAKAEIWGASEAIQALAGEAFAGAGVSPAR
jgi:hypothetical protein